MISTLKYDFYSELARREGRKRNSLILISVVRSLSFVYNYSTHPRTHPVVPPLYQVESGMNRHPGADFPSLKFREGTKG